MIGLDFKTIVINTKAFVDGLAVIGRNTKKQFWIDQKQGVLTLLLNGKKIFRIEDEERPIRSWID
jgi:hypothetical protein